MRQPHRVSAPSTRAVLSPNALTMTLLCAFCVTPIAHADVKFTPLVNGSYEYNSNLFLLPESAPPQVGTNGVRSLDERSFSYGAGLNVAGSWGETKLDLKSDIRRYKYDHFTQLDHNDELIALTLNWVAMSKISGDTTARYSKHITPFTDFDLAAVTQSTTIAAISFSEVDRDLDTHADYQIARKWQLSGQIGYGRQTVPNRSPTVFAGQSYDVSQLRRQLGVKYGGTSKLKLGLMASFIDGHYSREVNTPDFTINNYYAQVDYAFSDRSNVSGTLGRSEYQQLGANSKATTGGLSFNQALTAKTKYFLRYDRNFSAYPLTGTSQLSDIKSFGFSWQFLRKMSFSASYGIGVTNIDAGLLGPGIFADAHRDKLHVLNAAIIYDVRDWLSIQPYYLDQHRTSDVVRYEFKNHVYGVNLTARYP